MSIPNVKEYTLRALVNWRWRVHRSGRAHGLPGEMVLSLTSYGPRFPTLGLTLKCLLSQSVRPDKTILWLAAEDRSAVPNSVYELQSHGLEIRFCTDTKSYKKIIPALAAFPAAFIITADDDTYYPRDWLEIFSSSYSGKNDEALCQRAHEIVLERGVPTSYSKWRQHISAGKQSPLVFPTGVGGVMYPPRAFSSLVHDESLFMKHCPRGDDIWLYWMARLNGVSFRKVGFKREFHSWAGSQEGALWVKNVIAGENDDQIRAMLKTFGFPLTFQENHELA